MDDESRSAVKVLEALGKANERLIGLMVAVRKHPSVFQVRQGLDVRGFLSGTVVGAYVSAQLDEGYPVDWWLEVGWDADGWLVEARVQTNDDATPRLPRIFPDRRARTLDGLVAALSEAVDDLARAAREDGFAGG